MDKLEAQRKAIEQLRAETAIHRENVSSCIATLLDYIQERQDEDVLVKGFSRLDKNPYREKSGCTIL